MNMSSYPEEDGYGDYTGNTIYKFTVTRESDSVVMFQGTSVNVANNCTLTAVGTGATGTADVYVFSPIEVYMRYLLDVATISGLNTYALPADDIVDNNRNYKRVIGYAIDCATIYNDASTTPTKYGLADDGRYFQMPYTLSGDKFYPIARSTCIS